MNPLLQFLKKKLNIPIESGIGSDVYAPSLEAKPANPLRGQISEFPNENDASQPYGETRPRVVDPLAQMTADPEVTRTRYANPLMFSSTGKPEIRRDNYGVSRLDKDKAYLEAEKDYEPHDEHRSLKNFGKAALYAAMPALTGGNPVQAIGAGLSGVVGEAINPNMGAKLERLHDLPGAEANVAQGMSQQKEQAEIEAAQANPLYRQLTLEQGQQRIDQTQDYNKQRLEMQRQVQERLITQAEADRKLREIDQANTAKRDAENARHHLDSEATARLTVGRKADDDAGEALGAGQEKASWYEKEKSFRENATAVDERRTQLKAKRGELTKQLSGLGADDKVGAASVKAQLEQLSGEINDADRQHAHFQSQADEAAKEATKAAGRETRYGAKVKGTKAGGKTHYSTKQIQQQAQQHGVSPEALMEILRKDSRVVIDE